MIVRIDRRLIPAAREGALDNPAPRASVTSHKIPELHFEK
jgi:hypothetical protein